jgi:hypothetical protein
VQLRFKRRPDELFRLGLNANPNPGQWVPELIVPAEPKYIDQCTWTIGDPQASLRFQGISAGTALTIAGGGFEPGESVQAAVNGSFKIDGGGNWIMMGVSLNGGPRVAMQTGDQGTGPDTDTPRPLDCRTEFTTVPWNGIVPLTIYVYRAENAEGYNGTLSAVQGGTIVIEKPKTRIPRIAARPMSLKRRRVPLLRPES